MYIEQLYTNCLAEAAYYIESNGEVAIIDPLRDPAPYIQKAKERNATIKYVFETHFHADFISGHIDLARLTGSTIVYGPLAETDYKVHSAKDNETFMLGNVKIKTLHTPGHTPESTCYLLLDETGKEHAVFTGDTLFVGDVGRPDLLDGKMSKEQLAGMMYDSLQKLKALPDEVILYPAHGPGSACGKNIGKETWSTIGEQKAKNYALLITDKNEFIDKVTEGLATAPAYFFEDARINKQGYDSYESLLKKNIKPLSVSDVKKLSNEGCILLDTRIPDEFEKGFIKGSLNIGLNGTFAVWVGTLVNINQKLVVIAEKGKEEESITRLARVGFENVVGYLEGGVEAWKNANESLDVIASLTAEKFKEIHGEALNVIDVRKPGEVENNGSMVNASHIELAKLENGLTSLDKDKTYAIYCAGGYRSMIASSILRKQGFNKLFNIYGGFAAIEKAGIKVTKPEMSH
jgi:glyoxylase-like metal-dependent hydrolase (beta-lactamase superfamily II)/rhodanese-related sulfurtransferase